MTGEEHWREFIPESLDLRKFEVLSAKHENIGENVHFNDEPASVFVPRYQTVEMDLYDSTTGIEVHIKIPYIHFPDPKVTHPKKLLL